MTAVDKLSPGPNAPSGTAAATAEESAENNAQTTPTAAQMAAIAASVASAASSASSASATAAAALPETSPFTPRALVFADAPGRARRGADANDRRSDSEEPEVSRARRTHRTRSPLAGAGACARAAETPGSALARCPAPPSCDAAIGHAIGALETLMLSATGQSAQMGQCGKSSSTWTKERYEYILEFG